MYSVIAEVIILREFLEDWFSGRLEKTEAAYARFRRAMDPQFILIDPGGFEHTVGPMHARLFAAHGVDKGMRIWIENARVLREAHGASLVRYDELQASARGTSRRLSSAWIAADAAAPLGWRWLHLHETWGKD